jgi:hypothetical protein
LIDGDPPDSETDDQRDKGADDPIAADARERREYESKKRKLARQKKEGEDLWRAVLGTEIGRREVWGLLSDARTFEERFASGPNGFPNPQATDYYRGERDFGLRLYQKLLVIDLDHVKLMHNECDARFAQPKPKGDA